MIYPLAILGVAVIVTTVILIWVIPAFNDVFASFGAEIPLPTKIVIWLSDMFVHYWYWVAAVLVISSILFIRAWKRSPAMQISTDKLLLKLPLFGAVIRKAIIARWTRTLSTMFAAGVPLVESLDSVGGASGNAVYIEATRKISAAVSSGSSLGSAMQTTKAFPAMVTQMVAIGEESGALDQMITKVAEFHEEEVDNAVASLSSLMEPVIMVILGVVIGGLVIAMYLPIFQLGSVV
jgi:type IV pilus assembly protein PilC